MSEQTPQPQPNIPEADHFAPDGVNPRIDDVEKAHFMALAGTERETRVAAIREHLEDMALGEKLYVTEPKWNGDLLSKYTSDPSGSGVHEQLSVKGRELEELNKETDQRYATAAAVYDILKKTKR